MNMAYAVMFAMNHCYTTLRILDILLNASSLHLLRFCCIAAPGRVTGDSCLPPTQVCQTSRICVFVEDGCDGPISPSSVRSGGPSYWPQTLGKHTESLFVLFLIGSVAEASGCRHAFVTFGNPLPTYPSVSSKHPSICAVSNRQCGARVCRIRADLVGFFSHCGSRALL